MLRHAIRLMRQLSGLRESPKFYSVRLFGIVREALLRCGDSLVSEHRLDRREDVAWLTLHEIRTRPDGRLDFRALVAARKSQYEAEMLRTRVPRVVTSTGETFYEPPAETVSSKYATLSGVPASSGTYEGTARVLHNPHDSELLPGEILVAPGTDPAWTPLFLTAGAVVTETGGSMSHGAIVAREHGLPAVVGVQHATRLIRTGARLRVDGLHGTLALLDAPNGKEESNG